jgi:hypothetical protein
MATLTKYDPNKFTVLLRLAQLENLVVELQRELKSIELKEGKAGRDGISVKGDPGPRGERGSDGAPSQVPGPQGRPGESIKGDRGERGPAGPDSSELLEDVRKQLVELRAIVTPLNAEFGKWMEAKKIAEAARAEYMTAATERMKSKRGA